MKPHLTSEMTTMGVLNIVVGITGSVQYMFLVLGGGLVAALSAAAAPHPQPQTIVAAGSGFVIVALLALLCQAALIIAGGGVIRFAWWGRSLSSACAVGLIAINLLFMLVVFGGFHFASTAVLVYGGLLAYVCRTPHWKTTFRRGPLRALPQAPAAAVGK